MTNAGGEEAALFLRRDRPTPTPKKHGRTANAGSTNHTPSSRPDQPHIPRFPSMCNTATVGRGEGLAGLPCPGAEGSCGSSRGSWTSPASERSRNRVLQPHALRVARHDLTATTSIRKSGWLNPLPLVPTRWDGRRAASCELTIESHQPARRPTGNIAVIITTCSWEQRGLIVFCLRLLHLVVVVTATRPATKSLIPRRGIPGHTGGQALALAPFPSDRER